MVAGVYKFLYTEGRGDNSPYRATIEEDAMKDAWQVTGANWQALYGSAIGIAGQAERVDPDEHRAFLDALLREGR